MKFLCTNTPYFATVLCKYCNMFYSTSKSTHLSFVTPCSEVVNEILKMVFELKLSSNAIHVFTIMEENKIYQRSYQSCCTCMKKYKCTHKPHYIVIHLESQNNLKLIKFVIRVLKIQSLTLHVSMLDAVSGYFTELTDPL